MSIWDRLINFRGSQQQEPSDRTYDAARHAFIDVEVGFSDHKLHDIGILRHDGGIYHGNSPQLMEESLADIDYLCGHNIIHHDIRYLFNDKPCPFRLVDTLYLSPLLFPERPYHKLIKDDKLITEQLNNPVNDCKKARDLLMDEISHWRSLPLSKQRIFASLLAYQPEFSGFLQMVEAEAPVHDLPQLIADTYQGKICANADLRTLASSLPCELAYALALIDTTDHRSITPGWVLHNYPRVEHVVHLLRQHRCLQGCPYCNSQLDLTQNLKAFFGYDQFRTYEGEPLQERAAQAAVDGQSLLAIFPTGGGKSLTFQLPALMEGRSVHGLTVVISPLQSLMKDQVDNLAERGITDAVTINGLLDPITRALYMQRVQDGDASLLYIAPEMLRSKTIERLLLSRNVVRFVIDEAHCFSSWGQDFRVDYLYIGKFISQYQQKKQCPHPIPVSCFTATAKQKVIQDICDYFKQSLNIDLQLFASSAARTNLQYSVIHADSDEEKYNLLRTLVAESACPTIIYVSRTRRSIELAAKLTRDGYEALPFNGKMDSDQKVANQDAFMNDKVSIIVATSAFGMGVDKKDVGLVIHYDISDSLENYIQEAGRAGRDPQLNARCFVLYSDHDLDKHFILLNQTKLSISEIQQVWKAVKDLTRLRPTVACSALEIARQAGWDDTVNDIETRVRTAIAALEQGGYIERGNNIPHVYATGITVKNVDDARQRISGSKFFETQEVETAVRIIKSLISQKSFTKSQEADAESRIDYLADILGLTKRDVISSIERMRQEGILADTKDLTAFLSETGSQRKSSQILEHFARLEHYILNLISDGPLRIATKQLNNDAIHSGLAEARVKDVRTLLYFLSIKEYLTKKEDPAHNLEIVQMGSPEAVASRHERRIEICRLIIERLYALSQQQTQANQPGAGIAFSVIELHKHIQNSANIFGSFAQVQLPEVEEALLYLSKIGAMKLEGGFLVIYNAMEIRRIKENKMRYKQDDYRMLNEFYRLKIQQVHIVGEYANLMVKDYAAALQYVQDYFQMDYKKFVAKYFKGERAAEIQRNLTPEKYRQLFGLLSPKQMEIISDKESRCIVVAAGPGSGKTRVLVHKLASLIMLEDVKHEQLLMLTFSRAAATEFKQRLIDLIGAAANFVDIKTFHSFSFDLLGRVGNLDEVQNVVAAAADMIRQGTVEPSKIGKTVLVIDEAQDMGTDDFSLVNALMEHNEEMRVIAVGDDDQSIFQFRGSDANYMRALALQPGSRLIEMTENYRSAQSIVEVANRFVQQLDNRMKRSPIQSMSTDPGYTEIVYHVSPYMYQAIVDQIVSTPLKGSTSVLTSTNAEAAIVLGLLHQRGIKAKLIQSLDGLRFWNVAVVRYFIKCISRNLSSPIIPDNVWDAAKAQTYQRYAGSTNLQYLQRCVELFETTNKKKYYTDFKEFVFESSVEDFCDITNTDVVVSTIHKSKGHEYDNVYMMIAGGGREREMRPLYVGLTRAKQRLVIHTNTALFNGIRMKHARRDITPYCMPEHVVLQLTHRDVFLGFFHDKKSFILNMRAGETLSYRNHTLFTTTQLPVAKLSAKMSKEIDEWEGRGYRVAEGKIRFIVAWRPKEASADEPETAVILADLYLSRLG